MHLVWRLFRSDWRAGDLRLLFAALFLAVSVVTGLTAFIERLQVMLVGESSQFLAADRALKSPRPVNPDWLQMAADAGLQQSRYLSFQSMLYVNDEPQLISAKAVDDAYPLRGSLQYRQQLHGPTDSVQHGPAPGEIWAEARLFTLQDVHIGDPVFIGDARLTLTGELVAEPDRGAGFITMGPRVLMHWDDVEKTGVVQVGSRLSYHYLFAGTPAQIAALEAQLLPELSDSHEWMDLENTQPTVAVALKRARLFFMLASSIIVILASIAVAMASTRFSERHQRHVAVLKTLGATSSRIRNLYLGLLTLLAVPTVLLAWLLAWAAQAIALTMAAQSLEVAIPPLSIWPFALGLLTAFISLAAFSVPPLLKLKSVSALSIFQQQFQPLNSLSRNSLLLAVIGLVVLLVIYTGTIVFGLLLLGSLLLLVLLVALPAWLLLKQVSASPLRLGSGLTLALSNLQRRLAANAVHMAVFSISLMLLVIVLGVQNNLFAQWQQQLPEKTPNFFLVNIQSHELDGIQNWLHQEQIDSEALYPMVRGRLVEINGERVRDRVSKEDMKRAGADRELNLSWSDVVPPDNVISQGEWWSDSNRDQGVSVEAKLAERMGIKLGDQLTFMIEAQSLTATVSSLREVDWDRMRPNFYMLFTPQQLQPFPKTFMTSFYLPQARHADVSRLLKQWPTTIVIEVDSLIRQIRQIVAHVSLALQFVLAFVMIGSLLVLMTTVQSSLAQRLKENTILRALGATQKLITGSLLLEFLLIGLMAGVLASIMAQAVLLLLQKLVFQMPMQLQPDLWLIAPLSGALLIGAAGYWSARQVTQVAPMTLLRQQ